MKEPERVQSVAEESAVLVRVILAGQAFVEEPLDELQGLAATAGTEVVGGLIQRRNVPDHRLIWEKARLRNCGNSLSLRMRTS